MSSVRVLGRVENRGARTSGVGRPSGWWIYTRKRAFTAPEPLRMRRLSRDASAFPSMPGAHVRSTTNGVPNLFLSSDGGGRSFPPHLGHGASEPVLKVMRRHFRRVESKKCDWSHL